MPKKWVHFLTPYFSTQKRDTWKPSSILTQLYTKTKVVVSCYHLLANPGNLILAFSRIFWATQNVMWINCCKAMYRPGIDIIWYTRINKFMLNIYLWNIFDQGMSAHLYLRILSTYVILEYSNCIIEWILFVTKLISTF